MSSRTEIRELVLPGKKIRCMLAHDHVLLREGLRRLLEDETDIQVVGEAGNAAECLRKANDLRPDIVVAGSATFGMPPEEAQLQVARESFHTRIVFLSSQEQGILPFGGTSLEAGACAFRQTSAKDLIKMVRNARGGDRAEFRKAPVQSAPQPRGEPMFLPKGSLTRRELEVLKLLAEGNTVRMAASVLGLSSKTVDAHKFNLMRKLRIHNKAELVMWAIQKKVVKIPVNF